MFACRLQGDRKVNAAMRPVLSSCQKRQLLRSRPVPCSALFAPRRASLLISFATLVPSDHRSHQPYSASSFLPLATGTTILQTSYWEARLARQCLRFCAPFYFLQRALLFLPIWTAPLFVNVSLVGYFTIETLPLRGLPSCVSAAAARRRDLREGADTESNDNRCTPRADSHRAERRLPEDRMNRRGPQSAVLLDAHDNSICVDEFDAL